MFFRNQGIVAALVGLCLCVIFSEASEDCDLELCPGPLFYYEEIGCTPVFENATSCCPTSYNCDIRNNLAPGQCLVDGRVYNDSQQLPMGLEEDTCNFMTCSGGYVASVSAMCGGFEMIEPGCHNVFSGVACCKQYHVCENSPDVCNVDGKSYKVGDMFNPVDEPKKTCYCEEGYDGVNDERFCVWRKPSWCLNVINNIDTIRNNCAPVYQENAKLYDACNEGHICPEEGKYTIENNSTNDATKPSTLQSVDSVKLCKIGNVTMNIGDKLNTPGSHGSKVNCVCEVPPIPTCHKILN